MGQIYEFSCTLFVEFVVQSVLGELGNKLMCLKEISKVKGSRSAVQLLSGKIYSY